MAIELRRRGLVTPKAVQQRRIPVSASSLESTPMMTITARAPTARRATALTVGATQAFLSVLATRQAEDKIPRRNRVDVHVVQAYDTPTLVAPRSKALPMMVLVGGLIATFAAAFVRENLALTQASSARASGARGTQTGVGEGIAELRPTHAVEDTAGRDQAALRGPHPVATEQQSPAEIEMASVRRPGRTLGRPTGSLARPPDPHYAR